MNQKQKGFIPVIIGLIVLVLATVGGSGYYVWNKNKELKKEVTPSSKITTEEEAKEDLIIATDQVSSSSQTKTIIPAPSSSSASNLGCDGVFSITDNRDTNNPVYEIVKIGTQCWMKRNLNIGKYISGDIDQTNNNTIEKYCYNNDIANCDTYGGLYQYNEATNYYYYPPIPSKKDFTRDICPDGWHIPKNSEWDTLATYLGGGKIAGEKMRGIGFNNTKSDIVSSFSAYGSGRRDDNGQFQYKSFVAFFWSSTLFADDYSFYRHINSDESPLHNVAYLQSTGASVRCLKGPPVDSETQIIARNFLNNPTLENLKVFCKQANSIPSLKTEDVLSEDKKTIKTVTLSLSETISSCQYLNNPDSGIIFISPKYDSLLISFNDSDDDRTRMNKIQWNNKIQEYNKIYKLYGYSDNYYKSIGGKLIFPEVEIKPFL